MREILFRGKRIDNGEWVEGCLVKKYDPLTWIANYFILVQEFDRSCITGEPTILKSEMTWYKIDPSTVGQYTGLTDKDGKKIFEGDIVRCVYNYSLKEIRGHVVWGNGCFSVQDSISANRPAIDLLYQIEVIGDIHDNPELLEVSGDE